MSLPRRIHLLNTIANPPPTMPVLKSDFLEVISTRGYLHQCTDLDVLDQRAADGMITAYVGYDATADSLHIGNLVSIMMLHWLQHTGHRPIVLMGGGTTKVGDPSGRDETQIGRASCRERV